jgi:hypothetical protein
MAVLYVVARKSAACAIFLMIISEQCTAQKKIRKNNVLFSLILSFTVVVLKTADCLRI